MTIKSQIPKLKKNESINSFKARVRIWELRTGKKYPNAGLGIPSDEQRILKGDIPWSSKLDTKQDYSTGQEGEKWRNEVSDVVRNNLRIQKSLEISEALQKKVDADRKAGKLSNIPAPKPTEGKETETSGNDLGLWGIDPNSYMDTNNTVEGVKGAFGIDSSRYMNVDDDNKAAIATIDKKYPKGDAEIPSGKEYPTTIGGKKTSAIQKKLIDAGHDPKRLRDLMINYRDKYKNKRGW